jgi:predicted GNAT family acetyltransferase
VKIKRPIAGDGGREPSVAGRPVDQVAGKENGSPGAVGPSSRLTEMLEIRNETDDGRYTAYLDGRPVGFASWVLVRDTVMLPYVEVEPAHHDKGIGSMLVRRVLDDARLDGRSVLPLCPFTRRWVQLHPAYRDVARRPLPGELGSIRAAVEAAKTLHDVGAVGRRAEAARS